MSMPQVSSVPSAAGPSSDARPILDVGRRTDAVTQAMARYHAEVRQEVEARLASDAVVVVGMAQNPFVKKARAALDEAKVAYAYLEYGSYFGGWRERLAIKLWTGWPTFPQVFVKGVLIGGNEELRAALSDGSLKARLGA